MFKGKALWLGFGVSVGLLGLAAFMTLVPKKAEGEEKKAMDQKKLTQDEENVIVHKGTERPFSGKFVNHHQDGTYTCKRCGATLFDSDSKFDSGCGWPSFDDAIRDSVKEVPDGDGVRTEIVCAGCGAHLGHVFKGEGFTEKSIRHCVNSISLDFMPAAGKKDQAYFAGGCFWGVEYYFENEPGVLEVSSGYMGGHTKNPTYEQVCSGTTGHAETVEVVYDSEVTNFKTLARLFFEIHDPTQLGYQGPDVGSQYRSAVFYKGDDEKQVVEELISTLRKKGYSVVTEVEPRTIFYKAEKYHQDYYNRKGGTPYCHARVKRF